MPEYLSPGVYTEEIESGPQPIEGVSTSTAGFIGMAERGPVNVPILLTSPGDYRNWFGGALNRDEFQDPIDSDRSHCYLPYAVQGFFTNGGRRAYVMRVLPDEATAAHRDMFNRGVDGDAATVLLRAAPEGSGTGTSPVIVLDGAGLLSGGPTPNTVRIGSGSASEYIEVSAVTSPTTDFTTLATALTLSHPAATTTVERLRAAAAPADYNLHAATLGGETSIQVDTDVTLAPPAEILIAGEAAPIRVLTFVGGNPSTLNLAGAVGAHPVPPAVAVTPIMMILQDQADAGATSVNVYSLVNLTVSVPLGLTIGTAAAAETLSVTGVATTATTNVYAVTLGAKLAALHLQHDPVALPTNVAQTLESDASAGDSVVFLTPGANPGDVITLTTGTASEMCLVGELGELTLARPLVHAAPVNSKIDPITFGAALASTTLTQDASGRVISLASRMPGGHTIDVGTVLQIGVAPGEEYAVVAAVTGEQGVAPDPGSVVLTVPLSGTHPNTTAVDVLPAATAAPKRSTLTLLAAAAGSDELIVAFGQNWNANDLIKLTTPDGEVTYQRLSAPSVLSGAPGLTPAQVTLASPVQRTHGMGEDVVVRESLFLVQALDAGAWGRRLQVSVADESPGMVPRAVVTGVAPPFQLKLSTLTGVEPGTYLELTNSAGVVVDTATPLKVRSIDRANATIRLDSALSAAQLGAIGTATPANPVLVRSREFSLMVMLYRHPDAAVPSRNEMVLQSEVFRQLSLDPRHSRYIEKVIGATDGPPALEDRRPKGGSMLIRVKDRELVEANRELPRLGPEVMMDLMPGGLTRAARFALDIDGDDSMGTVSDAMYVGVDDNEPDNRTGIPALRNVPQISIVAVPGQGTASIQSALIAHCEAARYRFAVLDPEASDDALADIQAQRQTFDTKYAAIYYPWLSIPDPMPDNLASIAPFALPPSGHVVGIYARVDEQRGVHKAPANEVVLGITNVTRKLYKGEQDILNPEPLNINVIRDFRADGRSIRVWGARCITSDSDYKYVPVRRLIMFIEQSIDLGLQWAVFEPNAPALWARVTRSVTNFLNTVWRSGALEGTKPEEAFFVQCGTDTMTQDDIDNGRLIMVVGIAPAKPAEYVIIRIGLTAATNMS